MDVNADGLPDLLVAAAGLFNGNHGLYLNGAAGAQPGFQTVSTMSVDPIADVTNAGVLSLASPTVAALDLDADGVIDLVHMPQAKRYAVFSPQRVGTSNTFQMGRTRSKERLATRRQNQFCQRFSERARR